MEITSNDFIELSIQHKSKSKDKNTYYINDRIVISADKLLGKPLSKSYSAYCTNYISPSTCKLTNKSCRCLYYNSHNKLNTLIIPFYEILDFLLSPLKNGEETYIFKIPPYCPLHQNKKPNKNMEIIIIFQEWSEIIADSREIKEAIMSKATNQIF